MQLIRSIRPALIALLCLISAPILAAPPAPPPLEAYGDLPGVEDMALSPSGKGLATVALINGVRQLVVLDGERQVRAMTPIGDAKLRGVEWAGEDMVIVVTSSTQALGFGFTADKHEFFGAILVPLNGNKVQTVFSRTPSIAKPVFGNYGLRLIDGKWTGFYGGIEYRRTPDKTDWEFDHGRPALFQVDLAANAPRKVANSASEDHWKDWLVDGDGHVSVILDVSSESGKWEIETNIYTKLASGADKKGGIGLVAFGHDGSTVIYSVHDDANEKVHWYEVPLAGGTAREILADLDIERTYIDPANGRLLGYLQQGAPPRPVLFDPIQQSVLSRVYRAFPKLDVDIMQWTPSMSHFLVRTRGNADSGTWFVVDLGARKADPVGNERPLILPAQVGPISTVSYKAADGTELDGILTVPPGREAKGLPVVVFPHGGPNSQNDETFDWWAQAFASRGYAVFQPNFRGSTNRDRGFMLAGNGQWGRKMQTDVSDGLAELSKRGVVDPKRACIMGASYGGYAALAGVTLQRGLYRCAVSVAGVSDLSQMFATENRESGGNKMVRVNLKESLGDPKTFSEVSPRRSAARADAPILLIHGKDDTVVAFAQSQEMAEALRGAGKPYQFVTLREEDHWLSRPATRKQMLGEAVKFVQQHNPAD